MKDFNEIYYNSVECTRCNLCLDRCPAVRAVGLDQAPMYAAVYSALGSRFDLEMVTKEAFQCIDCHECECACPVNVPIADTMVYVRRLCKEKGTVPKNVTEIVEKALNGENILGTPDLIPSTQAKVAVFLGYAGELDKDMRNAFEKICKTAGISYTFLTDTADSGYFLERSGQADSIEETVAKNIKIFENAKAEVIVTPCSYSYEAFCSYYPSDYEYLHMSEFLKRLIEGGKLTLEKSEERAAYHGAHFLNRQHEINAAENIIRMVQGNEAAEPERREQFVSSSGIGGGLGLFDPETADAVSRRRAKELAELGCKTVVAGCVFEKYALKKLLEEKDIRMIEITEYVAQFI